MFWGPAPRIWLIFLTIVTPALPGATVCRLFVLELYYYSFIFSIIYTEAPMNKTHYKLAISNK